MAILSQRERIEKIARELETHNLRVEELLKKIPTSDARVLGELHTLVQKQGELIDTPTGVERGTMHLERAIRRAVFLRREYFVARSQDKLRK